MLRCPNCRRQVNETERVCDFCEEDLAEKSVENNDKPAQGTDQQSDFTSSGPDAWETCPSCGARMSPDWSFCRSCHHIDIGSSADTSEKNISLIEDSVDASSDDNTSSQSESSPSTADGFLESIKDLISTGDTVQNKASTHRDAGEYSRALETYDEAQQAYEEALEMAKESNFDDLIDTNGIEQRLTTVEEAWQETRHQRLEEEVDSIRSDLNHANSISEDSELEEAREQLEDIESDLTSVKESADQYNFDDLYTEIASLEQLREKYLAEVKSRVKAHPVPDEIPHAPNLSVDYDILTNKEPLGGGGNADVMKATLSTPDADVVLAIKEPRFSGTLHTDKVERILDEAETWGRLDDHDHIVGVVDYGSEPIPWIAMEYMDGGHLGTRSGAMEMPETLWTAIAVTKGVRHAHTRGVAHLDLKPENILLRTVDDAWDVPKVADWGLSKHLLQHSKSIEGMSPHYAAPEQFETEFGSTDNVTDIYQLGAVFYELFTGRPPFEGRPTQVMRAVMDKQPDPPSEIADIPETLDDILLTALAKEKSDRYDDIIYLRDDLRELFEAY